MLNRRSYPVNPQAMATAAAVRNYTGHPALGADQDRDTWLTPRYILNELGSFDLDPCAAASNPTWVTSHAMTKSDDGLASKWSGRVFMNPPFSNTAPWIEKHAAHGRGISLVPASVDSTVWRDCVWKRSKGILLLHGRTRFCNPDGSNTTGRPLKSCALIAWTEADADTLWGSVLAGTMLGKWDAR